LADSFQKPGVGSGGKIQSCPGEKTKDVAVADAGLKCMSFDWISTWKSSTTSLHQGRASEAYLLKHPEESDNIHVVI
jgi:D-serine deaminase-like pyridoxal phosphate-dependent protein